MEAGSIANKGEAEKCRDMAKAFMAKGDYAKAARFFDKSNRLFPLPGVTALKAKAEQLASGGTTGTDSGGTGSSSPSSSSSRPTGSNNNNYYSSSGNGSRGDRNGSSSSSSSSSRYAGSSHSSRSDSRDSSRTEGAAAAAGASGSTKSTASGSGRSYTPEQESAAKRILSLSKKGHYEALGVGKKANDAEIKKAYRKLALKFHPDKNSAPSAEQAFKAISSAFDCLSDGTKREMYDQYGSEDPIHQGGGGGFPGGAAFRGFGHGGAREVSPEELFNMFFQGAGPGFQAHFGRTASGRRARQQQRGGGGAQHDDDDGRTPAVPLLQQIMQFLPIILMLLMSFSSFSGTSHQPTFSLQPQGVYQNLKRTSTLGVSPDIPFYVNSKFDGLYKPYSDSYRRIEREVEAEYKHYIGVKCSNERAYRNNRLYQARFQGKEARQKAEDLEMPSCEEFDTRFKRTSSWR